MHKSKTELIEMLGIHFEQLYHIPPLAARILGTLIIDGCKLGLTFEELVEKMHQKKFHIYQSELIAKNEFNQLFDLSGR